MGIMRAWYYQQFDADFARDIPAEGYGGWKRAELPIRKAATALVVMHAWDTGTREQFPGWHRAVEYIPRADQILRDVFPPLLAAVRAAGWPIFHVVSGSSDEQPIMVQENRTVKRAFLRNLESQNRHHEKAT